MTDTNEDLELFDDAKAEFPDKCDLRDRLVAIWVTGKHGTRPPQSGGEPYPWYETYTLVLDDPNGATDWDGMVKDEHGDMRETLVESTEEGPVLLKKFQWSASGLATRLEPRLTLKDKKTEAPIYRPMIGRINERRSTVKGRNNPWSIAEPTEADRDVARAHGAKIKAITAEIKALREGGSSTDDSAFD